MYMVIDYSINDIECIVYYKYLLPLHIEFYIIYILKIND